MEYARRSTELAPQSPVALATLLESLLRLGNPEQAQTVLRLMNEAAPNNETAIIATMRFYLATGDVDALDSLAGSRVAPFIDRPDMSGTDLLFDRVAWAALARMALGDARGAGDLLEKGIPDPAKLDPQPAAANTLALFARARRLDGDLEGAAEIEESEVQLIERARAQGWDELAFVNYDPVLAEIDL